jgi:hypothetical protein
MPVRAKSAALFLLLSGAAPGAVSAQEANLVVTVSPDPDRLDPGVSTLSFSAIVPSTDPDRFAVVVCRGPSVTAECWRSSPATVDGPGAKYMTVVFESKYAVPPGLGTGVELCAILRFNALPGFPTSEQFGVSPWTSLASVCKRVSVPAVAAQGRRPGTASATAVPPVPTRPVPRVTTAARPPATVDSRAGAARRGTGGMLPDLSISFTQSPVARWVVRNAGQAPAPPTVVRFGRISVPAAERSVPALPPGASYEIVVTPDLDAYLVSATATVDPGKPITEESEWNNDWKSAGTR